MESSRGKIEMGAAEEAQIESFKTLETSNKFPRVVKENVEKCEVQFEESGADIGELFTKLYGEPGQARSPEEQRKIINKENTMRKRAERMSSENTDDGKTVEENESIVSTMDLIDEAVIKQDFVNFEQAEINWDDLFEHLNSPGSMETAAKWLGSFFSCNVV